MELATIINTIIVAYAMYVIIDILEGKNTIKSIVSMLSSFIASIAITICGGIVLILLNNRYIILVYQLMCLICIVVIACKIMRKE